MYNTSIHHCDTPGPGGICLARIAVYESYKASEKWASVCNRCVKAWMNSCLPGLPWAALLIALLAGGCDIKCLDASIAIPGCMPLNGPGGPGGP